MPKRPHKGRASSPRDDNGDEGRPKRSALTNYAFHRSADEANIKREFARRLQAAMVEKGWNESEFSRRTSEHLPRPAAGQKQGRSVGRDSINKYVRGTSLPRPATLLAMARALGKEVGELMPETAGGVTAAPFSMTQLESGRVALHVNRTVTLETALAIAALLQKEDK